MNSTPLTGKPEVRARLPKPAGFAGACLCMHAFVFFLMCVCWHLAFALPPGLHEAPLANVTEKSQTVFCGRVKAHDGAGLCVIAFTRTVNYSFGVRHREERFLASDIERRSLCAVSLHSPPLYK